MAPRSEEMEQEASGDEAIEEEEEEEEGPSMRRSKRRKEMKFGEDSGLTEEQRRELRRKQRNIAKELQEGPAEDDEDFVDKARKKNNELFEDVRYTREAVLDIENVDAIAAKFVQKADSMISAPRYDANKFVTKLKSKLTARNSDGSSFFDWHMLGREAGVCFNCIPSRVTFLSGPLENVKVPEKRKVRTTRQKKEQVEEEELEEEKPEQLTKKKKNATDRLSQAEKDLKTMKSVLDKRTKAVYEENRAKYNEIKDTQPEDEEVARRELKERGQDIEFVPFLVNPKSFTQTVENIFNFSFLIKRGEASIKMRKSEALGDSEGDGSPLELPESGCFVSQGPGEHEGPTKQCVISFTMKDWRDLVEAYDLEECDVPHRKGSKQKAFNSQQLSQQPDEEEDADE
jgi:non-structural maintenance of chromosomes element 4